MWPVKPCAKWIAPLAMNWRGCRCLWRCYRLQRIESWLQNGMRPWESYSAVDRLLFRKTSRGLEIWDRFRSNMTDLFALTPSASEKREENEEFFFRGIPCHLSICRIEFWFWSFKIILISKTRLFKNFVIVAYKVCIFALIRRNIVIWICSSQTFPHFRRQAALPAKPWKISPAASRNSSTCARIRPRTCSILWAKRCIDPLWWAALLRRIPMSLRLFCPTDWSWAMPTPSPTWSL